MDSVMTQHIRVKQEIDARQPPQDPRLQRKEPSDQARSDQARSPEANQPRSVATGDASRNSSPDLQNQRQPSFYDTEDENDSNRTRKIRKRSINKRDWFKMRTGINSEEHYIRVLFLDDQPMFCMSDIAFIVTGMTAATSRNVASRIAGTLFKHRMMKMPAGKYEIPMADIDSFKAMLESDAFKEYKGSNERIAELKRFVALELDNRVRSIKLRHLSMTASRRDSSVTDYSDDNASVSASVSNSRFANADTSRSASAGYASSVASDTTVSIQDLQPSYQPMAQANLEFRVAQLEQMAKKEGEAMVKRIDLHTERLDSITSKVNTEMQPLLHLLNQKVDNNATDLENQDNDFTEFRKNMLAKAELFESRYVYLKDGISDANNRVHNQANEMKDSFADVRVTFHNIERDRLSLEAEVAKLAKDNEDLKGAIYQQGSILEQQAALLEQQAKQIQAMQNQQVHHLRTTNDLHMTVQQFIQPPFQSFGQPFQSFQSYQAQFNQPYANNAGNRFQRTENSSREYNARMSTSPPRNRRHYRPGSPYRPGNHRLIGNKRRYQSPERDFDIWSLNPLPEFTRHTETESTSETYDEYLLRYTEEQRRKNEQNSERFQLVSSDQRDGADDGACSDGKLSNNKKKRSN